MSAVGVMEITPTVEMFLLLDYEFIVCHNTTVVNLVDLSLHLQYSYGTPPLRRNVAW